MTTQMKLRAALLSLLMLLLLLGIWQVSTQPRGTPPRPTRAAPMPTRRSMPR